MLGCCVYVLKAAPPPPDCLMLLFSSLKNLDERNLYRIFCTGYSTDILVKESRRAVSTEILSRRSCARSSTLHKGNLQKIGIRQYENTGICALESPNLGPVSKMSVEVIEKEIEFGIRQYENTGICTLESPNGTNPCVFILPNSKLYFLFYCLFYCLFLLPNSDYLRFYR